MKLPADDDWVRGLTVTVRNDSKKPITHISLRLRFPRPRDQQHATDFVESLDYGESPIPFEDGRVPYNPAAAVPPGESAELRLSDEDFAAVRTALDEAKYPGGIKRVRISVGLLGFADETVWMGGKLYRLDKESPGKLVLHSR